MVKTQIRKMVRVAARWPVVGRLVRIAVAVIRLPDERDYLNGGSLDHRVIAEMKDRQRTFETQQLPSLLSNLSDVNHRQIMSDAAKDNLVQSVPIALRRVTRDVIALRAQLDGLTMALDKRNDRERSEVVSQVIDTDKLAQARANVLKINLAFGGNALDGYLNVDRHARPGIDIVAEIIALPVRQGEVDEIASSLLLERYSQQELCEEILPYFHSLLKQGGTLRTVVYDTQAMTEQYVNGNFPYEDFRVAMMGGQSADGKYHRNMFTPTYLQSLLNDAGFKNITLLACGRKNGSHLELEMTAEK